MPRSIRPLCLLVILPLAMASAALPAASHAATATVDSCAAIEATRAPRTTISNGIVAAVVLLPDARHGFYRATRFDWSGVVWCLTYKGHHYFGMWNANTDQASGNAVTGPVEEFVGADGRTGLGYDQARPGELFVKPGVGVLRRINDEPYRFATNYPIVDGGKWSVRARKRGVSFRHVLGSPLGIAYVYDKKLELDAREPVLVIEHRMRNTGTAPIDIQVYNHDFFVIDGTRTGPDMVVRLPFVPIADPGRPLGNGARIDGRQFVFDRELADGQAASTNVSGFSDQVSDFHFIVENTRTGVGVEQTSDRPLSKMVFWSNPRAVCPEGYVHVVIQPGETGRWTMRYRFYARETVAAASK